MKHRSMYTLFGIRFFSGSISDVISIFERWIEQNKKTYVCVTGVHGAVEGKQHKDVYLAHTKADLVVPDGMPLVWVGKIFGHRDTKRIYGPDLFLETCRRSEQKGWRIFLYGTTTDTLRQLNNQLQSLFPKINIVGRYAPPFRSLTNAEKSHISHIINTVKPHIVWVGLSTPKQELWMYDMRKSLKANILIGVGATFDFIAGTKKQAPLWMRSAGLEWLFRLIQEPKRLGKRYFVNNTRFIYFVLRSHQH